MEDGAPKPTERGDQDPSIMPRPPGLNGIAPCAAVHRAMPGEAAARRPTNRRASCSVSWSSVIGGGPGPGHFDFALDATGPCRPPGPPASGTAADS